MSTRGSRSTAPRPATGPCGAASGTTIAPTYRLPQRADQAYLNPGNGWVSRLCHDPRVAVAVLNQMLAPPSSRGRLFVLEPHRPLTAWTEGDRVASVVVQDMETGRDSLIEARYFLDATAYGDLLALAGVEHVVGAESRAETGEPDAGDEPIRSTSRRSPRASPSSTSRARTIRSTSHGSTKGGVNSPPRVAGTVAGLDDPQP